MVIASIIPAILNVLAGEIQAAAFCETVSEIAKYGMYWWGLKAKSPWISSVITKRLCLSHMPATPDNSSFDHTLPTGLWGLHKINILFLESAALFSKSLKSMWYFPSISFSGFLTIVLLLFLITIRNSKKKGDWTITPSPSFECWFIRIAIALSIDEQVSIWCCSIFHLWRFKYHSSRAL